MTKKKNIGKSIIFAALSIAICLIFSFSFISGQTNYCCEKTISGAWCQNAAQEECDSAYSVAPTSCDSTSYCKRGCCYDNQEGLCMESTPQRVCQDSEGIWADDAKCGIAQCSLGCCILGEQGAFVTLSRCKALSSFYELNTDFRKTITNEVSCLAAAGAQDMGACVFEDPKNPGVQTCRFTSRAECKTGNSDGEITSTSANKSIASPGFYKDVLCTAPELGVDCKKTTKTTVINGKDEVYYTDTCGNIANIYDADRYNDNQYWKRIYKKSESCGYGSSSAGSKTCGNCDYMQGSIAKKATGLLGKPSYGDYICADLSCKKEGKKHGESWCAVDTPNGDGKDTAGSKYYREICLNNEIITEPCADYRNEICIEDTFNGFSEAACRVNRWQDCVNQVEQADCENYDARDCMWIKGFYFSAGENGIVKSNSDPNNGAITPKGLCVPAYPPGLQFWGNTQTLPAGGATTGASSGASTGLTANSKVNATTPAFGTGYVANNNAGDSASAQCSAADSIVTLKWIKTKSPLIFWDKDKQDGVWTCANDECRKYVSDASAGTITDTEIKKIANDMNRICYKLGDCGGYVNWLGKYTDDGYAAYHNQERIAGSGGAEVQEKTADAKTTGTGLSGNMIKDIVTS